MYNWAKRKAERLAYLYIIGGHAVWYGATQGW